MSEFSTRRPNLSAFGEQILPAKQGHPTSPHLAGAVGWPRLQVAGPRNAKDVPKALLFLRSPGPQKKTKKTDFKATKRSGLTWSKRINYTLFLGFERFLVVDHRVKKLLQVFYLKEIPALVFFFNKGASGPPTGFPFNLYSRCEWKNRVSCMPL